MELTVINFLELYDFLISQVLASYCSHFFMLKRNLETWYSLNISCALVNVELENWLDVHTTPIKSMLESFEKCWFDVESLNYLKSCENPFHCCKSTYTKESRVHELTFCQRWLNLFVFYDCEASMKPFAIKQQHPKVWSNMKLGILGWFIEFYSNHMVLSSNNTNIISHD